MSVAIYVHLVVLGNVVREHSVGSYKYIYFAYECNDKQCESATLSRYVPTTRTSNE